MQPYADRSRDADAQHATRITSALRAAGLIVFALWTARYMRETEPLMHGSLLIFHEAGHVLFMPFGEFMMVFGGSLFQLAVPAFFVVYFIRRHDLFAAAFAGLYLAASLSGVALYIADARAGDLPLLGGERSNHDWTFLLIELDRLHQDTAIGAVVRGLAGVTYLASLALGIWQIMLSRSEQPAHATAAPPA